MTALVMTPRSRKWRAPAVFVAAVVGSACAGGPDLLDMARVRRAVATRARRAYPGVTLGRTHCPKEVERRRGRSFVCTLPVGGSTLRVHVAQRDAAGHVVLRAQEAVIQKQSAELFVAQHTSIPATVDCGVRMVLVVPPGARLPCSVTFVDGTMQTVTLRVVDTSGTVAIDTPAKA